MSIPATPLQLPPTLPYPITVTRITSPVETSVSRGSQLLEYSFRQSTPADPTTSDHKSQLLFGSWDSTLDGTIEAWNVGVGQTLTLADARRISLNGGVVTIKENCRHDVQIAGMCAVCGEDMTRFVNLIITLLESLKYLQSRLHGLQASCSLYLPNHTSCRRTYSLHT